MDELQLKQLADLTQQVTDQAAAIKKLTDAFESATSQFKDAVDGLREEFDEYKQEAGKAYVKLLEGKSGAAAKEKPAAKATLPKDNLKFEGKEYKWGYASFHVAGHDGRITAEEAATDKKIIQAILKTAGQTILVEQA